MGQLSALGKKRRNFFPEPKFQMRFLRLLVGGSVLQIAVTCTILYYFLNQNYLLLVKYAGLEPEITALLYRELRMLIVAISLTFVVFLLGMTWLGVLFSHRIAGAIFALKRTIGDIRSGRDEELKLRKGDEFQELVDGFNSMIRELKTKKGQDRASSR